MAFLCGLLCPLRDDLPSNRGLLEDSLVFGCFVSQFVLALSRDAGIAIHVIDQVAAVVMLGGSL